MTDQELAAALRAAFAASPAEFPDTLAAVRELACPAPRLLPRPVVVTSAIHEPVPERISLRGVEGRVPAAIEQRLAAALATTPRPGETIDGAFSRMEACVAEIIRELAPIEARALQRRVELAADGDALARQFRRLAPERQRRLVAYMADARRRQARARVA